MKILFVTPYLASPPQCGAQRRLEGLMRGLSARHEVSLLSFATDDIVQLESTRAYCHQVVTVNHDVLKLGALSKRFLQLRSIASQHSFEYLLHQDVRFQSSLDSLVGSHKFDVVQFEFAQMGVFQLPRGRHRPTKYVLDEHNIEYEIVKRTARAEGSMLRKGYSEMNWHKLRAEERDAWNRFDGVALTSNRDEAVLKEDRPSTRTVVIPNAVDLEAFRPNDTPVEPGTVLFFGALDYYPNIDGIQYFLDQMLPEFARRCPTAKLVVVGRNPPASLSTRQNEHVQFTGYVDDPRPYLDRAAVVIVPLRIGGGTRFKIVEAMGKGKAIVSTTIGAEGLNAVHGEHLLLSDDPGDFVAQISRVLADTELANRLGAAGRRFAEESYGWDSVVKKLEQFYSHLLS